MSSTLIFFSSRQAQRDIIFELRRIAFDVECEPNNSGGSIEKRKSMYTRDYKKLGFIVSCARLSEGLINILYRWLYPPVIIKTTSFNQWRSKMDKAVMMSPIGVCVCVVGVSLRNGGSHTHIGYFFVVLAATCQMECTVCTCVVFVLYAAV